MQLLNVGVKNIKLTVIDSTDDNDDDSFIEIIIKQDNLKNVLQNLLVASAEPSPSYVPLTKREKEVLQFLSTGKNNSQISQTMNVSIHTIKVHIHNIFNKLSVQDRTEAVVKAIKYRLIDI